MSLKNFANNVAANKSKAAADFSKVNAFLGSCSEAGVRISYGALTTLAVHLKVVEPSNFGIHQRGAQLVKELAPAVQPFVTRKDGSYDVSAISWDANQAKALRTQPVIDENSIIAAYEATLVPQAPAQPATPPAAATPPATAS